MEKEAPSLLYNFPKTLITTILNQYDSTIMKENKFYINANRDSIILSSEPIKGNIKNNLLINILENSERIIEEYKEERIAEELSCPISKELIDIPVITEHGMTYEKQCLIEWCFILKHDRDPLTNKLIHPIFYCNKPVFAILEGLKQIFGGTL